MANKRIQLTLFINENESGIIESIRKEFNPEQFELIKSHVTLCREDELIEIETILENLKQLDFSSFYLDVEAPKRFSEEKGLLLPLKQSDTFQNLRKTILKKVIENPRIPEAHITLMHPRNSACTDAIFEEIKNISFPKRLAFDKISLIEQEIGQKWVILKEFILHS